MMKKTYILVFTLFLVDVIATLFFGGLKGIFLIFYRIVGIGLFVFIAEEMYGSYKKEKNNRKLIFFLVCLAMIVFLILSIVQLIVINL